MSITLAVLSVVAGIIYKMPDHGGLVSNLGMQYYLATLKTKCSIKCEICTLTKQKFRKIVFLMNGNIRGVQTKKSRV